VASAGPRTIPRASAPDGTRAAAPVFDLGGFSWSGIPVHAIRTELALWERGGANGARDLPRTDAAGPDPVEREIVQHVERALAALRRAGDARIAELTQAIERLAEPPDEVTLLEQPRTLAEELRALADARRHGHVLARHLGALDARVRQAQVEAETLGELVEARRVLVSRLRTCVDYATSECNALLREYREANRQRRRSAQPASFATPWSFPVPASRPEQIAREEGLLARRRQAAARALRLAGPVRDELIAVHADFVRTVRRSSGP